MANGNGVSRGDRNRNARLARLRELLPLENAIVGINLADRKQMVLVCDHDSKVLARKTFLGWVTVGRAGRMCQRVAGPGGAEEPAPSTSHWPSTGTCTATSTSRLPLTSAIVG